MRDRFLQQEVWERMGVPVKEAVALVMQSPEQQMFQQMLFSKIVPNCKKLGLLDAGDGWLRHKFERAGRDPVRGLGRHRRGVRPVRHPGRDRCQPRRHRLTCPIPVTRPRASRPPGRLVRRFCPSSPPDVGLLRRFGWWVAPDPVGRVPAMSPIEESR